MQRGEGRGGEGGQPESKVRVKGERCREGRGGEGGRQLMS